MENNPVLGKEHSILLRYQFFLIRSINQCNPNKKPSKLFVENDKLILTSQRKAKEQEQPMQYEMRIINSNSYYKTIVIKPMWYR